MLKNPKIIRIKRRKLKRVSLRKKDSMKSS